MSAKSIKSARHDGRLAFAALCVAAALAYLAIGLMRDDHVFAFAGFAIMIGYGGLLLALRKRGEPLALLSGKPADERQAQVVQRSLAATCQLLLVVLVVAAMVSFAIGSRYAGVFCGLCAIGGLGFMVATAWYSRRI